MLEIMQRLDLVKLEALWGYHVLENRERRQAYCGELWHSKQSYRKTGL